MRLAVTLAALVAGCSDTGLLLRISGDGTPLDAFCLELDAGGTARFGHLYDAAARPLPQTLTAVSESHDAVQALVTGLRHGQPRLRDRRNLRFRGGQVLQAELSLSACLPSPTEGRFQLVGSSAGAVDQAQLLPSALGAGGVVVAFSAGSAARYEANVAGLVAAGGLAAAPQRAVRGLSLADLDADCRGDLVVSAEGAPPSLWARAADGTFPVSSSLPAPDGMIFAAGDVDGDGAPDLVGGAGAELRLFVNQLSFREVSGAFDAAPSAVSALSLGDLDGDGDLDLVVAQSGAPPRVYFSDGSGHFTLVAGALPPRALAATASTLADLDGDGDLDLALATSGDGVHVYLNRGNGFLEDRSFALLPLGPTDVPDLLAADLDADCLPDLLLAGAAPQLWLSSGQGQLAVGPPLGVGEIAGAAAEDIDGDGRLDLLLFGPRGLELLVQR